jgi:bacillithiol biosynthesis cysteine-adding enzyme BshC
MKSSCIDYNETGYFSSTVLSYLNEDPKLTPFISYQPTIKGFKELIESKKIITDRITLVNTLLSQYKFIPVHDQVKGNIELLLQKNTFTVTTGHQLNLFTGPLYFLYKIVTAINLAKELKANFPDKNFVPVYWMATEDHDFAEINHVKIHGKKIAWDEPASGATGRLSTKTIIATVKEYLKSLGISEHTEKLSQLIEEAYLKHPTLSDATRFLVNALFCEYGLVILDADDKELKRQFAPIIERDIIEQNSFRLITESSQKLEEQGFKTQVNAREINFFYLKDQLRERITKEDNLYYVLNTDIRFTEEELKEEIRDFPERFSPNVIMRPLYEEFILPNLAYIGGGGELAYWLQLKKNFDSYNVGFPILILRNSGLIVNNSFQSKLNRLNLQLKDIFNRTEDLKKDWVLKHSENSLSLNEEREELKTVFEKIKLHATKIDTTLGPSTEAVKARLNKALANLEQKLIRAEKRNHEDALTQIENLRNKYFPGDSLQERSENFGLFYVQYGDNLIQELLHHFKPLDFKFTILEP